MGGRIHWAGLKPCPGVQTSLWLASSLFYESDNTVQYCTTLYNSVHCIRYPYGMVWYHFCMCQACCGHRGTLYSQSPGEVTQCIIIIQYEEPGCIYQAKFWDHAIFLNPINPPPSHHARPHYSEAGPLEVFYLSLHVFIHMFYWTSYLFLLISACCS